jgi:hypothetical protein
MPEDNGSLQEIEALRAQRKALDGQIYRTRLDLQ